MKAMVLTTQAPVETRPLMPMDLSDPEPAADELLVRVSVCGVCRTDLHVIEGDLPSKRLPLVPGHQVVGTVVRTGESCGRFEVGRRVGIAWLRGTCGHCGYCARGDENLCDGSRYTGYHADGGYAELAVVPEAFAYAIPESFSDEHAAPLLCAGIIGYRALQATEMPAGGTLALYGFGSSAHVVLQIARHRGYRVLVATRGESHRRLALEMGAVWAGDAHDELPERADAAIVFAPAGDVVPPALRSVRKAGVVVLAGIHMSRIPPMEYEPHLFHEKKLRSVEANTRCDGEGLLREAAAAAVRPKVTSFDLLQANEALVRLKNDGIDGSAVLSISR